MARRYRKRCKQVKVRCINKVLRRYGRRYFRRRLRKVYKRMASGQKKGVDMRLITGIGRSRYRRRRVRRPRQSNLLAIGY